MNLKNRNVLVTGSSDRVGRNIALTLAKHGANIIVHYHANKDKAEKTAEEIRNIGSNVIVVQGDLSKKKDWLRISHEIVAKGATVDVLINNAAIFYKTPFFDASEDDWYNFMDTNLKSIYLGCQILGKAMLAQKSGKIINIADVSGETVWQDYIPYCVSKAGVIAITKGLAKVFAPHVTVNCIAPGTVLLAKNYDKQEEQNLIKRTPLKRIGSPQDIANTVLFLIEGSDFVTGAVIKVDGGRSLT